MAFEDTPYLGADIQWTCSDPESLSKVIDVPKNRGLQHLAQFNINMTIERHPVPIFYSAGPHKFHPERALAEAAFQPKSFTVRLEKGVFPTPICAKNPKDDIHARKYALRLVFDSSSYPPPEEWTDESNHSASSARVWEWTTFVSRDLGPFQTGSCAVYIEYDHKFDAYKSGLISLAFC